MYDPDIFSALTDARVAGYYQPTADYYNQFNRVQQAYENERALNRRLAREEQSSLKAYSEQLRNRIQEQEAKPQVTYLDPVTNKNLGVNPFPQSEYTPEQLGLKKVINGVAQEPQGPIDYAPNNSRDMQIISRGRDFEKVPKTPMYMHGPGHGDPAFNPWYQVVPDEENSGKTKLADERAPEYILNRAINPAYYKEADARGLKLPPQVPAAQQTGPTQQSNPWKDSGQKDNSPAPYEQVIDEQTKPTWGKIGKDIPAFLSRMYPVSIPYINGRRNIVDLAKTIANKYPNFMPSIGPMSFKSETPQWSGPAEPLGSRYMRPPEDTLSYIWKLITEGL